MEKTHYHSDLVLGLDAGGSKIRAVLAGRDGTVVGQGVAAAGNALSVPVPQLTDRLHAAIAAALPAGRIGDLRALAAGFAGVTWLDIGDHGRDSAQTAMRAALDRAGVPAGLPVSIRNDVEVAFASAPGSAGDGIVLVGGTGAVAARLIEGHVVATVDGHGAMLDDAGSGHWIGRRAAQLVLRALDGRGDWTSLVPALTATFLDRPIMEAPYARLESEQARGELVPKLIDAGLIALAELCPLVTTADAAGDPVAGRILDEAADALAETVAVLQPEPTEPLVTTGGLLGPGGPLLDRLARRVAKWNVEPAPVADGTAGALRLAWELV